MSPPIRIRFLIPVAAASALILATAGGALAKCEHDPDACEGVSATLDPGGTLLAGGSETVGVLVLEDEQPYAATAVVLIFNRVADATVVRAAASPVGRDGRWETVVELPAEGTWTAAVNVQGLEYAGTFELDTMHVGPAAAAVTTSAASSPLPPVAPLMPWLVVGTALVVALGAAVTLTRRGAAPARG